MQYIEPLNVNSFSKKHIDQESFRLEFIVNDNKLKLIPFNDSIYKEAFELFKANYNAVKSTNKLIVTNNASFNVENIKIGTHVKICCFKETIVANKNQFEFFMNEKSVYEPKQAPNLLIKVHIFDRSVSNDEIIDRFTSINNTKNQTLTNSMIENNNTNTSLNKFDFEDEKTIISNKSMLLNRSKTLKKPTPLAIVASSSNETTNIDIKTTPITNSVVACSSAKRTLSSKKRLSKEHFSDASIEYKKKLKSSNTPSRTPTTPIAPVNLSIYSTGVTPTPTTTTTTTKTTTSKSTPKHKPEVTTSKCPKPAAKQSSKDEEEEDDDDDDLNEFNTLNKKLLHQKLTKRRPSMSKKVLPPRQITPLKQQPLRAARVKRQSSSTSSSLLLMKSQLMSKKIPKIKPTTENTVNKTDNRPISASSTSSVMSIKTLSDTDTSNEVNLLKMKREESDEQLKKLNNYIEKYKKNEKFKQEIETKLKDLTNSSSNSSIVLMNNDHHMNIDINQNTVTTKTVNINAMASSASMNNNEDVNETLFNTTSGSDDNNNNNDVFYIRNKKKPKKKLNLETIKYEAQIEAEFRDLNDIRMLTPEQIRYMVLRDINYYASICAGQCEHSWRHLEFLKFSKKSSNILYSNTVTCSFTEEQCMSAIKAFQSVFCKHNHRLDEYIVKVLLPEALIKLCMRIYQCSKDDAEDYLHKNSHKKPIEFKNKDLQSP